MALVEEHETAVEEPVTEDFDQELAADRGRGRDARWSAIEEAVVPEQVALTPQGNKRGVTLSEEIDYRPPPAKAPGAR